MYLCRVCIFSSIIFWVLGLLAVLVYHLSVFFGRFISFMLIMFSFLMKFEIFWLHCRKILGRFNYFTVLGFPSALGAAVSSIVLAERVAYHYAHGLSTIVITPFTPCSFYCRKKNINIKTQIFLFCKFTGISCVTFAR